MQQPNEAPISLSPTTSTSSTPDPILLELVSGCSLHISEIDPGMMIQYHEAGLLAHATLGGYPNAAAAKRAIAGIITAAGMKEILNRAGQPSGSIFIGTINQFVSAMNNLVMTTWVRPVPGVPDVGDLWELTSAEASQDINYAEFLSPFHG